MNETNTPVQIGWIETPYGNQDTQGYRVYSIDGIGVSLKANGGGLDKGVGLYLVEDKNE